MPDLIARLAKVIDKRLRTIGCPRPSLPLLKFLLETTYHATLRREEGRFIRGSVTFVDPRTHVADGPQTRRAHYPAVWPFGKRSQLTVERLVKLSRAVDMWSGSVAVFGTTIGDTYVWGVVDQMVQANVGLHLETDGGFSNPGLLEITMEGVGDLTIYHRGLFLGGVRGHQIVKRESDPLWNVAVGTQIFPHLVPPAIAMATIIPDSEYGSEAGVELARTWVNTVSRLCIGLRRLGTGGTFLITNDPHLDQLHVGERFEYRRLGDSMILSVLDKQYRDESSDVVHSYEDDPDGVPFWDVIEANLADADDSDRQDELTGAVKLVTSLASVDGLVLLSPLLHVQGFGVKIGSAKTVQTVYDGQEFERRGVRARKIDPTKFGTRHNSILRYCRRDKEAIGIVVSQDGNVRVVMTTGRSLVLWDNVKLLRYRPFTKAAVDGAQHWLQRKPTSRPRLGYTDTPKTLDALLRLLDE